MPPFSHRHNYAQPPEISVREEMPIKLRWPIAQIAARKVGPKPLRQIVDGVLDPYGIKPLSQSGFVGLFAPNADADLVAVRERIDACPWFRVYDIIEAVHRYLVRRDAQNDNPLKGAPHGPAFEIELNRYFVHAGIGWQLTNGQIVIRGDNAFGSTVSAAVRVLDSANRPTAAGHVKSAMRALSERPKSNTSGAVAQATNAVECVLGEITGDALTLGKYLDRHPKQFHPALKKALDGIYGYASDAGARHGKEGIEPSYHEAVFVVATCAAACTLLTKQPHTTGKQS